MRDQPKWARAIYTTGVIAMVAGAFDPLEGSVVILAGSALVALSTYFVKDRHWKIFMASFILITLGVCGLFYISSMGGIGGSSTTSWWWIIIMFPYPIGWIINVVVFIGRAAKKAKIESQE